MSVTLASALLCCKCLALLPFARLLTRRLVCSQGLVQAVGVSNYGPKQLQKIHKHLTKRGVPLASVQVEVFSRTAVQWAICTCVPVQRAALQPHTQRALCRCSSRC